MERLIRSRFSESVLSFNPVNIHEAFSTESNHFFHVIATIFYHFSGNNPNETVILALIDPNDQLKAIWVYEDCIKDEVSTKVVLALILNTCATYREFVDIWVENWQKREFFLRTVLFYPRKKLFIKFSNFYVLLLIKIYIFR